MVGYNLTGIANNSTGILGFTQGVNETLMFGWLGILILIGLAAVIVSSFYFTSRDWGKSLAAGAYISFILALLLRAIDLIPNLAIFITLIIAAAATAFLWKS